MNITQTMRIIYVDNKAGSAIGREVKFSARNFMSKLFIVNDRVNKLIFNKTPR